MKEAAIPETSKSARKLNTISTRSGYIEGVLAREGDITRRRGLALFFVIVTIHEGSP